jgi:hypothetical protein
MLNIVDNNVQSEIDESLITLSENNLPEEELREMLVEIRDKDYDLLLELLGDK